MQASIMSINTTQHRDMGLTQPAPPSFVPFPCPGAVPHGRPGGDCLVLVSVRSDAARGGTAEQLQKGARCALQRVTPSSRKRRSSLKRPRPAGQGT